MHIMILLATADIVNMFFKIKVIMQKPLPNYSLSSESFTMFGDHMASVKMMEISNILLKPKGGELQDGSFQKKKKTLKEDEGGNVQ